MSKPRVLTNAEERKLIAALRSDKYKQTPDWLRKGDRFCCLGVYCDISGSGEWKKRDREFSFHLFGKHLLEPSALTVLPTLLARRLRWDDDSGILNFTNREAGVVTLAMLNDDGFTFNQIADLIGAGLVRKLAKRKKVTP